jgi:hypothetical protein
MIFAQVDPNVWLYATCFLAPLCGIFFALWIYNRRESRRRKAAALANEFGAWGLSKLAHALSCYAIGDYSGFVEAVEALLKRIQTDGLPDVFRDLFEKLLSHFAKDATWREKILKAINAGAVASGAAISPVAELISGGSNASPQATAT